MNESTLHVNVTRDEVLTQSEWNFATNIVDMTQILVQSFLLISISSHKFCWSLVQGATMTWIKFFLQFLAISNFINWLNASFLEFQLFQKILWNTVIYSWSAWTGLLQLLFPVALFFRFHTVHTLMEVYVGYKTQHDRVIREEASLPPILIPNSRRASV